MEQDRNTTCRRTVSGFTLIETLVAIVVLSVSLTVIMRLFSGGLRSRSLSDDYMQAMFYSRTMMEEILASAEFQEGVETGAFDERYAWEVTIALEPDDDRGEPEKVEAIPLERWRIDVKVSWRDGTRNRTYATGTMELAPRKTPTGGSS